MFLGPLQQNLQPPRLYAVIAPSSGWVDPTALQVLQGLNGSGGAATWFGNAQSPTTSSTFDWPSVASGLTSGVSYRVAFVWSNGASQSNVAVSGIFTTTSGTAYTQSIAGSLTTLGTLRKQTNRVLVSSITLSGIISKQINIIRSGVATLTGVVNKFTSRMLNSSTTLVGSLSASTGITQAISGAITISGALFRTATYARFYASTIAVSGQIVKSISKNVGGTLTLVGVSLKLMFVALASSITAVGALSSFKFTPTVSGVFQRGMRFIRRFIGRR